MRAKGGDLALTSLEAQIFHERISATSGVCRGGYATSPGKRPGMEWRWFLVQMLQSVVVQDPTRGHISH